MKMQKTIQEMPDSSHCDEFNPRDFWPDGGSNPYKWNIVSYKGAPVFLFKKDDWQVQERPYLLGDVKPWVALTDSEREEWEAYCDRTIRAIYGEMERPIREGKMYAKQFDAEVRRADTCFKQIEALLKEAESLCAEVRSRSNSRATADKRHAKILREEKAKLFFQMQETQKQIESCKQ